MLAAGRQGREAKKAIVFLGWEPHPMNTNFDMTYLSGGDDCFGPNYGGATVYTNVRAGYTKECPNVGKLLENLEFTLKMENEIMGKILDDGKEPCRRRPTAWLKANPAILDGWLDGVTTKDGGDGLPRSRSRWDSDRPRAGRHSGRRRAARATDDQTYGDRRGGLADRQQDTRRPHGETLRRLADRQFRLVLRRPFDRHAGADRRAALGPEDARSASSSSSSSRLIAWVLRRSISVTVLTVLGFLFILNQGYWDRRWRR